MTEQNPAEKSPEGAGPSPKPEVEAERFDARTSEGRTYDMPPVGEGGAQPAGTKAAGNLSLAALAHLLGLADFTVSVFMIGVIATLVFWLLLRDTDPEVDFAGKESLNFQLNLLVWWLAAFILSLCLIGIPMMLALVVLEIVLVIVATVQTLQGERYRYPLIYRVIP